MGTVVRLLTKAGEPGALPLMEATALDESRTFAEAPTSKPAPAREREGITVEDLVIAICSHGRVKARIKSDGRFMVAGGVVCVELVVITETKFGPREVVRAELMVRTLVVTNPRPLHTLLGLAPSVPEEGIIWDIVVDGSDVVRVGRQVSLVKLMQMLRTTLSTRRVII